MIKKLILYLLIQNIETSHLNRLILNLTYKINLNRTDKYVVL